MIPSPFSNTISFKALPLNSPDLARVLPEEEALLSERTTERRRLEFRAGRAAARLAMKDLGVDFDRPILRGTNREPIFPVGVVGSIAHCSDLAVAAVSRSGDILGLGIDIEQLDRDDVLKIISRISTDSERIWSEHSPDQARTRALTIFSGKEAIYKALYPIERRYIGFKEVNLVPQDTEEDFVAVATAQSKISALLPLRLKVVTTQRFILSGAVYSRNANGSA